MLRTITVADLLDLLENEDPNAQVIISADYGDFSHTPQALPLKGDIDVVTIRESGYSQSGYAIADVEFDDEDAPTFVCLR